jgi:hypothetical protein
MSAVQQTCRFVMRYAGEWYCKRLWYTKGFMTDPELLRLGCPADCPDFQHASWRVVDKDDKEDK